MPENVFFFVRDVFDKVVDMLREKCEKKGIVLNYIVDEDFEIFFDSFNFEQILVNLLDNAIKYTEIGSITLKIWQDNLKFYILVSDTGIGISKENIPRIFERFFVVSKSRSRSRGGTGLGLAIVKHIVKIHNGDIEVKSQPDSGSEFLIRFSRKSQ
jgi:two-component system phosphate regulon sensor histidine kinase PhoR